MLNGDSCHSLLWYGARSRAYIEDGRYCNEELLHLVQTDERLYNVKKNAKTIDLLIIDNFAMVNTARLNQPEVLCRKLGIFCFIIWWNVCMQRMFYQLPPTTCLWTIRRPLKLLLQITVVQRMLLQQRNSTTPCSFVSCV
jgi:hypothetical protein